MQRDPVGTSPTRWEDPHAQHAMLNRRGRWCAVRRAVARSVFDSSGVRWDLVARLVNGHGEPITRIVIVSGHGGFSGVQVHVHLRDATPSSASATL